MISLREITENNFDECIALSVDEGQEEFVAKNVTSLAQAWLYQSRARPFAIYNNEEMVGFMMLDIDDDGDGSQKTCYLWRLMMDKKHQAKGYGKAAMLNAISYVKSTYPATQMKTSIVPGNVHAEKLYKQLGFVPTGELTGQDGDDDREIIMALKFSDDAELRP